MTQDGTTKAKYHFDIDEFLGPFIPSSRLHLLPRFISRFLGYRSSAPQKIGNLVEQAWAFVGVFCGIALIESVTRASCFQRHHPPLIIGSFGAAAILEYNVINSPLAQPRNMLLGNLFSAAVGVGLSKLFELNSDYENLRWLVGALSCGCASLVMGLTNTLHPPAGATALLAATDPTIQALGWFLIPLMLLGSLLMLLSALLINNIQRCYPLYWWTDRSCPHLQQDTPEKVAGARIDLESQGTLRIQRRDDIRSISINEDTIILPSRFQLEMGDEDLLVLLKDRLLASFRE